MDNKLIFENYLLVLKSTVEVYIHGTLESSNQDVRSNLKNNLNGILEMQANTYDLMHQNGWYQINNVKQSEIEKTLNKLINQN